MAEAAPTKPLPMATTGNKASPKSIQKMMQDKQAHMNQVFAKLVRGQVPKIQTEAETLRMISAVNSWHMAEDEEFIRYNKNFQEALRTLELRSKEGNPDATYLAYIQVGMVCMQCHKHVRDQGANSN